MPDRRGIERVVTHNVLHSLDQAATGRVLERLLEPRPDLIGLQEWGADRATLLGGHYGYDWANRGAMPIGVHRSIGKIVETRRIVLAEQRRGVRTTWATEALIRAHDGRLHAVLNVHLVAHHHRPANYAAWREGRAAIHAWVRANRRHAQPWVLGDVNRHNLTIRGLRSCFDGRRPLPTFRHRSIDGIWTTDTASKAWVLHTASDHRAVIASYRKD